MYEIAQGMMLLSKVLKYEPKFANLTLKALFCLTNKVVDHSDIEFLQSYGADEEYFSLDMFDINAQELTLMVGEENEGSE